MQCNKLVLLLCALSRSLWLETHLFLRGKKLSSPNDTAPCTKDLNPQIQCCEKRKVYSLKLKACWLKCGCNMNTCWAIYYCVVGMHNKAETYYWVEDCNFMTAACLLFHHFSTAQQTPPKVANAIYLDCTSSWSTNQHSDWYTFNHPFISHELHKTLYRTPDPALRPSSDILLACPSLITIYEAYSKSKGR
jgi:hypothetical protein